MDNYSFVTLCTFNQLAKALAAMHSLEPWHGNISRKIYLLDFDKVNISINKSNILVFPLPIWIQSNIANSFSRDYSVAEICFAVKPLLLIHELNEGVSNCHYIDSDIFFYADPDYLINSSLSHPICLTPHYYNPIPENSMQSALTLLRAGIYNGGYISVANCNQSRVFLKWWSSCCSRHGYNRPTRGMCGDQRWLDLVPTLFPGAHTLRDECVNVAYWNFHERILTLDYNNKFYCNGKPLVFFHFSGFEIKIPEKLSGFNYKLYNQDINVINLLCKNYSDNIRYFESQVFSEFCSPQNLILHHNKNRIARLFRRVCNLYRN